MEQEHLPLSVTPPPALPSTTPRSSLSSPFVRCPHCNACFEPDPMRGGNPSDTVLAHSSAFDFSDALPKQRQREPMDGARSVRDAARRSKAQSTEITITRDEVMGLKQAVMDRLASHLSVDYRRVRGRKGEHIKSDILASLGWPSDGGPIVLPGSDADGIGDVSGADGAPHRVSGTRSVAIQP